MAGTVATQLVLASYDLRLDAAELISVIARISASDTSRTEGTRSRADERAWSHAAAHLEVGLLLRRVLNDADAEGPVRARLRSLARRATHDLDRLVSTDAERWAHELLVGRWILLDVFDAGARRFLVGLPIDHPLPPKLRVTDREADALRLASTGMANKAIASELDVELGTAGALVSAASRKITAWAPDAPHMPHMVLSRRGAAVFPLELGGRSCLVGTAPTALDWARWGLTAEEITVVSLALRGESNAEIARERGKSASTVQNQLTSAFQKLGVRSRRELRHLWVSTRAPGAATPANGTQRLVPPPWVTR